MNDAKLYLEIATWSQVVSSIVFIAVLVFMWMRWVMPVMLAAQARSNKQIAEAERRRDEVKGALTALREEIESAGRDAQLIKARAEEHAEHERQALLSEATDAGERGVREAGRELERARVAARQRLRDDVLAAALALARRDAAQRVDGALDSRLVERFASTLESSARG